MSRNRNNNYKIEITKKQYTKEPLGQLSLFLSDLKLYKLHSFFNLNTNIKMIKKCTQFSQAY